MGKTLKRRMETSSFSSSSGYEETKGRCRDALSISTEAKYFYFTTDVTAAFSKEKLNLLKAYSIPWRVDRRGNGIGANE